MEPVPKSKMSRFLFFIAGILLCSLIAAGPAPTFAQDPAAVRGFVRSADGGQSLQGANVILRDTTGNVQSAVATNADGLYQISEIPPGRYRLSISFVGYTPHRDTLQLAPGEQRTVSISLSASAQQLDDVTIEGRRPVKESEAGLRQIRSADIESIPSAGPGSDLSTYLRGLPGVTTTGDRGGRLYVRGGTPSQNKVLVEGMPLHKPFHIIGLYSAFPGDLVSTADFYGGGFGAEYMGRLSSVLDVQLRPGNVNEFKGSVGAGPFLALARFEGPISRGGSSFLVNVRHSLIEHSGPTLLNQQTPYKFYDLTAKYHSQGESSQCSLVGMRTYDRGRLDPNRTASFRWNNTAFGGECLLFGDTSAQVLDASFGTSHFGNAVRSVDGTTRDASAWRFYTNLDLTQPLPNGNSLQWGFHLRADQYRLSLDEPFLGITSEDYFRITTSPYIEASLTWNDRVTLTPSLGTQFQFSRGLPMLEPRLRLSYRPRGSERMKLTAAGGLYRQLVTGVSDERDAGSTFQALLPSPFTDHPPQAAHALLGWNQQIQSSLRVSVEGWYKKLWDLAVPRWTPIVRFNTTLSRADGQAFGADLSIQYEPDPLRLDLTYGYGQTTYQASEDDLGGWTGDPLIEYSPPYDLRHKIGVSASLDLSWVTASARWQYNSGLPFTQVYGYDSMLEVRGLREHPFGSVGTPRALFDRPYQARLPAYHRLDASLKRTFTLSPLLGMTVEMGAINAYDRRNVFYVDIFTQDRVDQLPVIPYLSLQINFE